MSQRRKNVKLIISLGALVIVAVALHLGVNPKNGTFSNSDLLSVQDTATVDNISIVSAKSAVQLRKTEGGWMLNSQYKAETQMVTVLLAVLKEMRVSRRVPNTEMQNVAEKLRKNGYLVTVSGGEKVVESFYAVGNETKTISYLKPKDEDTPVIVNIPGYESYVAGIFEITSNDWRNRTVLSTSWRSLKKLFVQYTQFPQHNFEIAFDSDFLRVKNVDNLDTAAMIQYVGHFYAFQADRYLEKGANQRYDSLLQTPATVKISILDIRPENSKTISFYPSLPNDPMMCAYVHEDQQAILLDSRRIQPIFAVRADFVKK
jgi:hypothetical protein